MATEWLRLKMRTPLIRFLVAPGALLGLLFGFPNTAFTWSLGAHSQITLDAFSVLPPSVRGVLEPYEHRLMVGSHDPDFEPRFPHDHALNGDGTGSAHILLRKYANEAEELIRRKASWPEIAFALGQAAHLIQDLNQPQHAEKGEGSENHRAYESIAFLSGWPRASTEDGYDGFDHIRNYEAMAFDTAAWSRQYFGAVQSGPYGDEVKPVIAATWNHAVNDVADLWLSILMNAQAKDAPIVKLPTPLRVQKRGCLFAAVLQDTRYAGFLDSLRRFRDTRLRGSALGWHLIETYYGLSDLFLGYVHSHNRE